MGALHANEYLQPTPEIEDELCAALAEQEIPEIALDSQDYETKISGAEVKWHLIQPADERLIKDARPVLIENGLLGSEEAYSSIAEKLASLGYIVLTKQPPRRQKLSVALLPHNIIDPMELQAKAGWAVMRHYMKLFPREDEEPQKFHLVCHSMGGPVGADTAENHPEHIASITLIGSAGLEKHHTPVMAKRLMSVVKDELLPAFVLPGRVTNMNLAKESVKHVARSINRLGREAIQVSNRYTVPALARLQRRGIPIHNIQPEHDHFFPYPKQLGSAALFNRFIKFNVGRADHLAPQTQAELVAAIVDHLVSAMPIEMAPAA